MKVFGRTTVSEFLGDYVVFRNLEPVDKRLPVLNDLRAEAGLEAGEIPRKQDPGYARVIGQLLQRARALEGRKRKLDRLIFIGDTRLADGNAFDNICQAAGWRGIIFIGSENDKETQFELLETPGGQKMVLSNRWSALNEIGEKCFPTFCAQHGFPVDESTAVILDLDKTTLAARGRNAHVIDEARVQAVRDTVESLLGEAFEAERFLKSYNQLNQPEFHPFTADNQDYLAYICLILGSGLYDVDTVIHEVQRKRLLSFRQFIDQVEIFKNRLPAGLQSIHEEIYAYVQAGDPTPFKPFRYNEFRNTIQRMGFLPDDTPVAAMMQNEILITQEVRTLALKWKKQGAFLFGLSDKPDEASIPTPEMEAKGFHSIHRQETHAVGMA